MSWRLVVGVSASACITPTCQICQPEPVYSLYIRKFTQLLVIRTKLANWAKWGINVEIATKSAGQIVGHPRFKTGKSLQNWQNLAHVYNTDFGPCQNWQKNWQNAYATPVTQTTESLYHPSYQVVQRAVQQSPQRLVKTPLVEDLLDPNRPRNGLIDGGLALQIVVVQD